MFRRTILILAIALFTPAQGFSAGPGSSPLDYGTEGLTFPPAQILNGHTPRTAQLLGEAYARNDPVEFNRIQYIADLGQVALPECAPFLSQAMKDSSPKVRAEAARSAAVIQAPPPLLLTDVEKLLSDPDAQVRREAVLAAAKMARAGNPPTDAIARGLSDSQPPVIAAALQSAWTKEYAAAIAAKLAALPDELKVDAIEALARLKASEHAPAIAALLKGDLAQRVAALRALADLANPATADAVGAASKDSHPTVRREAITAMGKFDPEQARSTHAIGMLDDADPTVRQAAVAVLTPVPTTQAMTAILAQLDQPYAPLHESARRALSQPADDTVRAGTITAAADLLSHANPRRREDGSFILGRLRSPQKLEQHIALINVDLNDPSKADWLLIAQAAESVGLIGDASAVPPLMTLLKAAPDAAYKLQKPQSIQMGRAMASAMLSLARLKHKPALAEAIRILQLDPGACPAELRATSAFAIGVLSDPGKIAAGVDLRSIYSSMYEARMTKFEALKALGNAKDPSSAEALKTIAQGEPLTDLRWIAHWAYQRCAGVEMAYTPPIERPQPPVSITDLSR